MTTQPGHGRPAAIAVAVTAALASVVVAAGAGRSHPANPARSALTTAGQLTVIGVPLNSRQQPVDQADGWYGLATVGPRGHLRYLVRCPHQAKWCGELESLDWSPNGRWLALSVTSYGAANPYNGIHVIDLATGVDRQIRNCVPPECDWLDLDWSPDGARLAYVTGGRIYLIDRDGSGRRFLQTGTEGAHSSPSWSPDGTRIAFATRPRPHEPSTVHVIRTDGTHRVLVARGASDPAWSPDVTRIAVASGCRGIKLFTPAGEDVTPGLRACRTIGFSGLPVWSLDGRRIAIAGIRPIVGNAQVIYVMNADGRQLRLLTREANGIGVPGRPDASWQPRRRAG